MYTHKLTIDNYESQYVKGFLDHILCLVYVKHMESESTEYKVDVEEFAAFIEEEDIEDYFNNETMHHIESDLEVFINKKENLIYSYSPALTA